MSSYFRGNSLASLRCGKSRFVFITSAFYVQNLKVTGTKNTSITDEVKKECDYGEACTFIPKHLPGLKRTSKDSFFYITFMCLLEKNACLTMDCPPNSTCVIEGPLPPKCVCNDGYIMKNRICVAHQPVRSVHISERPPWSNWKPGISGQLGPLELRHSGPPQDLHIFVNPKDPWDSARRRFTHSGSTTAVYGSGHENILPEDGQHSQDDTGVGTGSVPASPSPDDEQPDLDSKAPEDNGEDGQEQSPESENEPAPTDDEDDATEAGSVQDENEVEDEDPASEVEDGQDSENPASEDGEADKTAENEDSHSSEAEDGENSQGDEAEVHEDGTQESEGAASEGDDFQQVPEDESHPGGNPEYYHSSGHPGGDPEEDSEVHPEDLETGKPTITISAYTYINTDKLDDSKDPETGAVNEHHNEYADSPENGDTYDDDEYDEYEGEELGDTKHFSEGHEPKVSQMTHDDNTTYTIPTLRTACKFKDGRIIVFDKLCDYQSCKYRYKVCS
ncbi:hypothetical protein MACJ_001080 [Theileria orientalis]|uniref:EGF-like domain-containing protein n=1 Tax=Theileria orientalis TaxID=68886 RepID=A0A976M7X7_THEOR|nr:hypothetical protein MACJ_001080 [Theileria orientalis]